MAQAPYDREDQQQINGFCRQSFNELSRVNKERLRDFKRMKQEELDMAEESLILHDLVENHGF